MALAALLLWATTANAADPAGAAKLLTKAQQLEKSGRTREAETEYAAVIGLAAASGDAAIESKARENLGWLQYNRGAMADALANFQAVYRVAERRGDEKGRLDALALMAHVYADSKVAQYDRAIEYYRQILAGYEKHGQPNDVADTLYNIATTLGTTGNAAAADPYYRRALAIFEQLGMSDDVAQTQCMLGTTLVKEERANEALPHFDASLAYYERQHDPEGTSWVRQLRGIAYRRIGRNEDALRDLAAARAYYEKEKNARYLERNVDETALVYAQLGDWRNAYVFRQRHGELQQELAVARRDELSSQLRVKFDSEKKEQENRALTRENGLRGVVIALTALLAVALGLLFWRQVANTRRMRTMAMTDELTRLPNRRHILTAVDLAFAEARRSGEAVALIVFDIDHFKRINDTYGHAAGDEILKRVARACRLTLPPSDQVGRIGGEEFLVLLPQATAQNAADVAERLRVAVEQLDLSTISPDLRVTISLGVHATTAGDAHAAIAAADALLYRAKEEGRNRVAVA